MLKKLLAAVLLAAFTASHAVAHPQVFTICNKTSAATGAPTLVATKLTISRQGSPDISVSGELWPGQCVPVNFFKDPPCDYYVKVENKYGGSGIGTGTGGPSSFTCTKTFNVCAQTKITFVNSNGGFDCNFN